jgi:hypothetical protein
VIVTDFGRVLHDLVVKITSVADIPQHCHTGIQNMNAQLSLLAVVTMMLQNLACLT